MESSRGGSIRIQHLTGPSASPADGRSRFPKLDECAHFHYELVELGSFQVSLYDEELKPLAYEDSENKWWHVSVTSQGKSWVLRRSYENFRMLDQQLHRCIYDRKFSGLQELPPEDNIPGENQEESIRCLLTEYLARFSQISGNQINCGPVLNWLELDNRGHRLLVPDGDNCPINTPAVAAAYSVKRYTAQAGDEISFEVGDMISVIDMPPPEESVWWRGKRGFQVGFFPCECVAVIGDKVPHNLQLPGQLGQQPTPEQPTKPVLRKHGKLIAFFRSFILSRPSRRRLKQSGILKERVFGCDLGEHLLNSGHEIPMVLKCCAEFIEAHGIVDGIYRLSGVTSNIQKLRNAFDEDRIPALYEDEAILQDIHSVASLLKMYFRELPNPLCTYQLYHTFVNAIQSSQEEGYRLLRMRDAVQKLPPPHYRTLEYLMRHLARVAECGGKTGMTPRNVAIVWAPNLLRCKELEVGGVAALQGVGVQAVVTEFLVCYADLIFCDGLPPITTMPQPEVTPKRSRPKSLAISTPTKLLSLEEARTRALLSSGKAEQEYIEVGGGPSNLPAKYHTVIELPGPTRKRSGSSNKRSPLGWKSFFSKSGRKSSGPQQRKASTPSELGLTKLLQEKALTENELTQGRRRLRPVKSAESLASGANSSRNSAALESDSQVCNERYSEHDTLSPGPASNKSSGHSRSVSHDSYFDHLAETPVHPATRPSQLAEEDTEDHFSSSLDLSEIQLNFDLEESEMRIFSEDETLVSTSVGSGSIMSQASPHVGLSMRTRQQMTSSRRVPVPRARPEDPLSGCPSADPSPKKQKTCAGPISPQGSSRSKRSRLEEQLACSAAELRYIDSQSPENQQLLVQAEVHQHHQYTKTFDDASPTTVGDSPPNNTSPSLAEATVSDNESFTLHSSSLPTPDTPLLLYTPLLDDETCSTSISTNTTPDYEYTPGSTKYHRLSSSPVPTPKLTPSDSSYENMLVQASRFTVPKYENVPVASSEELDQTSNYSDLSGGGVSPLIREVPASKYINVIDLLQQDNQEMSATPLTQESQITVKYENIVCKDEDKENAPYEVMADSTLVTSHVEPASTPPHLENTSGELTLRTYENIHRHTDQKNVNEEHLYEDVQLSIPSATVQQDGEQQHITELQVTTEETEIYQKVKYFRRSIYEVNELVEDSRFEVETEQQEEKSNGERSMSSVKANEIEDDTSDIIGNQGSSATGESLLETSEENNILLLSQECSVPFIFDDSKCTPSNDSSESKDCSNEGCGTPEESRCLLEDSTFQSSSVEGEDGISLISSGRRRTSSMRSETEGSNSPTQLESPQLSPEHRRIASMDLTRRRIDSEIGRDILRERRMKQELEEMRTANQGYESSHQSSSKQNAKYNVRELLSKFETPLVSQLPAENSSDYIHASTATTQRLSHPTHENETETIGQVSSSPDANEMQRTPSALLIAVEGENTNCKLSKNTIASSPILSRKDTVTPKLSRRSDPSSHSSNSALPPCVRARLAKAARNKLVNSTALSVSLDEGQFLSSSNQSSGLLMRVQTSPDINDAGIHQDGLIENSKQNPVITSTRVATVEKPLAFTTADLDDPQRRERIERYKEERRIFLREKYRSESFRGERDEILQRLKQKAIKSFSGTSDDPATVSNTECTRSNSFRSLGDKSCFVTSREREAVFQSLGSERVSESKKLQDEIYGRSSSPKPVDDEVSSRQRYESASSTIEKQTKRDNEVEIARHRRSSTSDKQKFNSSSFSPEKSATVSVAVRHRLSAEQMGPDSSNLSGTSESDSDKCLSPSYGQSCHTLKGVQTNDSFPCADTILKSSSMRSPKGQRVSSSESMFQKSYPSRNHEVASLPQAASAKECFSNLSCENPNLSRRKNTENFVSLQEQLDVEIRLPARGKLSVTERRPASIPALSSDHRVLSDSPRRKSSAECGGNQTSPSFCIRDMAAFFENRRDPPNQTPSRPAPTGKQYLSSV